MKKSVYIRLCLCVAILVFICGACAGKNVPLHGEWENNTYRSDFAGISFTLPDGWTISSDEFLAGWMGVSKLVGEDAATKGIPFSPEALKENVIRDMLSTSSNPQTVVSISFENLDKTKSLKKLSAKEYLEVTKTVMQADTTSTYEYSAIAEQKIGKHTFASLASSAKVNGSEQRVFARKVDNYMVLIAVSTSAEGESVNDILNCFS